MENLLNKQAPLFLTIICIAAFLVARDSPVTYIGDSFGSLLTSQAILQQRTIKVDSYMNKGNPPYRTWYQFAMINGHYYYFFPLGTSIIAIPFVWVENLRGQDMSDVTEHVALENILSALTIVIALLLMYLICRCFINPALSLIFTTIFTFGSSIASTMGTALWSINITAVLALWILLLLSRDYLQQIHLNPYLTGILLWFSFMNRPTISLFIILVFFYCLIQKGWNFTIKLGVSALIPLIGYLIFCYYEFGQWIPPYYTQQIDFNINTFLQRLNGILFSPSRGLFVFQPYLLLVIMGLLIWAKRLIKLLLVWLSLLWIISLPLLISSYFWWWGGYSYGSRLLTESLPGWLLLSVIVFSNAQNSAKKYIFKGLIYIGIAFGIVGIFIHTTQGLYNENTSLWNSTPSVDSNNETIFDWRYPQFMASPELLKEKYRTYLLKNLPMCKINEPITAESENVIFIHFLDAEKINDDRLIRWANGNYGRIMFKIDQIGINLENNIVLRLNIYSACSQLFNVQLNGEEIGEFEIEGEIEKTISFNPRFLNFDTPNVLKLAISNKGEKEYVYCKGNQGRQFGLFSLELSQ